MPKRAWGYMIEGRLTITYSDGSTETAGGGDLFYWPPGHTVAADEESEVILFSPQREHREAVDHIIGKLGA